MSVGRGWGNSEALDGGGYGDTPSRNLTLNA